MNTAEEKVAGADLRFYDNYVLWTDEVAQYPQTAEAFYLALGVAGEGSELIVATQSNNRDDILAEAGDVCWYLSRYIAKVLGKGFGDYINVAAVQRKGGLHRLTGPRFALEHIGKICGVEKKRVRDGETWDDRKRFEKNAIASDSAIALISWLEDLLRDNGYSLAQALVYNQKKLSKRLEVGTIKGDGDHR